MEELVNALSGRFIVLDGPDGSGKSTQIKKLRDRLHQGGAAVEVLIDPGTTKIGQKIRSLLLDRDNGEIGAMCETLLFMASRAELVGERVRPALKRGAIVLCDRFVSATVAYQGASGVDPELILKLGEIAIEGQWPDLTVILDMPAQEGMNRLGVTRERLKKLAEEELQRIGAHPPRAKKKAEPAPGQLFLFGDRMESRSSQYHEQVRQRFLRLPEHYPAKICVVDATGTEQDVHERLVKALSDEFAKH